MIPLLFAAALAWQTDWNTAFAQARQQHKLVFVVYTKGGCPNCYEIENLLKDNEELGRSLSGYELLRVDLDRSGGVPAQSRFRPPAYVVFDAGGRERFRIYYDGLFRADDWHIQEPLKTDDYPVYGPLRRFTAEAPAFVKAAELFDTKRDLEAQFLAGTTYNRLKMTEHARAAFAEAKKLAEAQNRPELVQSAEVQSAFSYVHEGRAAHAVELLSALTKAPPHRQTEAIIWLALGHAYVAATDKPNAVDAFRRAQSLAPAGTRTNKDATAALARLE